MIKPEDLIKFSFIQVLGTFSAFKMIKKLELGNFSIKSEEESKAI
jgi:hypothetical protein